VRHPASMDPPPSPHWYDFYDALLRFAEFLTDVNDASAEPIRDWHVIFRMGTVCRSTTDESAPAKVAAAAAEQLGADGVPAPGAESERYAVPMEKIEDDAILWGVMWPRRSPYIFNLVIDSDVGSATAVAGELRRIDCRSPAAKAVISPAMDCYLL
jgi:hypothetical protein